MFVSLGTLDSFHLLLSTQLIANLTEVVDPSFNHCHIFTQKIILVQTVANNALIRRCFVVFDRLWSSSAPILNTAFSLKKVYAKYWIHYFLISLTPLLSHTTSIYDWPKRVCGGFWFFSRTTAESGRPERSASCVSVGPRLNSAYHLFNLFSNGAESGKHFSSKCCAWPVFFQWESNA